MIKKAQTFAAILPMLMLFACGGDGGTGTASVPETGATGQLNIYNWADYVDPATLTAFEKKHNVKIQYDYYDSNETLEAKVLTGHSGYDVVGPGAMAINRQIGAGAYMKLDKSRIPNYGNIDADMLKMLEAVDPGNQYAVPFYIGADIIAVNKEAADKALGGKYPEEVTELLFNPEYTGKLKSCGISLLDSPSEVVPVALKYLDRDPASSDPEDIRAAIDLVKKVLPDIKRFSSSGYINDLARGDLCVSLAYSNEVGIAANRAREAGADYTIEALISDKGVGFYIDTLAIPKDAVNVDNAYKYINDTLDPKVAAANGDFVTGAPGAAGARELMKPENVNNPAVYPTPEMLKKGFLIKPLPPESLKLAVRLWQEMKSGR